MKREIIPVAGRIIEENFDNPKRGVQKLRERIDAMTRTGQLDLLNNRTNQEIARLALNLHLMFKEPRDLCDPGSVLKRHGCGENTARINSRARREFILR